MSTNNPYCRNHECYCNWKYPCVFRKENPEIERLVAELGRIIYSVKDREAEIERQQADLRVAQVSIMALDKEIERLTAELERRQVELDFYTDRVEELRALNAKLLAALKKTVPALERCISASAYDAVLRDTRAIVEGMK